MSQTRQAVPPMPDDLRDLLSRRECACRGKRFPLNFEFVYSTHRSWHMRVFFHDKHWVWMTQAFERCPASYEATPDRIDAHVVRLEEMLSRIDNRRFHSFTLENFKDRLINQSIPNVFLSAFKLKFNRIINSIMRRELRNVWFYGDPGRGKTHSAAAILRILTENGRHCAAYSSTELFEIFRRISGHDLDFGLIDTIAAHDVILVDGLEDKRVTDAVKSGLTELINRSKGAFIWTSHLDPRINIPKNFDIHLSSRMLDGTQGFVKELSLTDFSPAPDWREAK